MSSCPQVHPVRSHLVIVVLGSRVPSDSASGFCHQELGLLGGGISVRTVLTCSFPLPTCIPGLVLLG